MKALDELREWTRNHTVNCSDNRIALVGIAERIYKELAERYVALPLDADGVPIHVGDILNPPADCPDYLPLQVVRLTYDGYEEEWYFDGEAGGFTGMVGECMDIAGWTHHHPRTVEDVLREFTDAILEWAGKSGTVAEVGFWSEVAAEYIAKLQLREGK